MAQKENVYLLTVIFKNGTKKFRVLKMRKSEVVNYVKATRSVNVKSYTIKLLK